MRRTSFLVISAVGIFGLMATGIAFAQSKPEAKKNVIPSMVFDCTDVSVDYKNDPSLTQDEKIAIMDRAFLKSLSKYDGCQRSQANSGGTATNTAGGNIGASGSGQEGSSAASGGESVATSDMTGQEKPKTKESETDQSSNAAWSEPKGQKESEIFDDVKGTAGQPASVGNGKLPEDIPPADNDSVLEAQIRQAAINETNPELKAKLWNEYRKYKGLPAKN